MVKKLEMKSVLVLWNELWEFKIYVSKTFIFSPFFFFFPPLPVTCYYPTFQTWESFDVLLTVHLSITLANDQLDAQIFNTFITILYMYMFQAISCSSSGGQTVLIQHLVSSLSVSDRPVHRTVTYWEWRYQLDAQIFNTFITVLYVYMFRAISCSSSGGHIILTFWHRSFTFKFSTPCM